MFFRPSLNNWEDLWQTEKFRMSFRLFADNSETN